MCKDKGTTITVIQHQSILGDRVYILAYFWIFVRDFQTFSNVPCVCVANILDQIIYCHFWTLVFLKSQETQLSDRGQWLQFDHNHFSGLLVWRPVLLYQHCFGRKLRLKSHYTRSFHWGKQDYIVVPIYRMYYCTY